MRYTRFAMLGGALAGGAARAAAAMAPASGTIVMRATATFSDGTSADRLYEVTSDDDSDGDGHNDSGWLRVACDGAVASAVYYTVKSPRDVATGQSSGKRMHKPFIITKQLDKSTPMFKTGGGKVVGSTVGWDLATGKGSRVAASTGAGQSRKAPYNIKENKSARVDPSRASNDSAGKGALDKTMMQDDWMMATLKEGSPNLCS